MIIGYDFDIARIGDKIEYEHPCHNGPLVGTITEMKPLLGYDVGIKIEVESHDIDICYIRMDEENIGEDYYSVDLLDWEEVEYDDE